MGKYIIRRLMMAVPTVLGVVTIVFFVVHLAPGDPINLLIPPELPSGVREDRIADIEARYGFDRPLHIQYLTYLRNMLTLDLGESLRYHSPITDDLKHRIPNTLQLGLLGMAFSTALGIGLGVMSAVKRGTWLDNATMLVALCGVSMPSFLLGLLLMLVIALYWGVLPASGYGGPIYTWEGLQYALLPAITLGASGAAILARFTRSSMLEIIHQDYVRTARAKGLRERSVIIRHALKNTLIPIITLLGLQFGAILSGTVIVETVFAWPGIGRYLITGIEGRDFPVVQGTVLFIATGFVLVNLLTDLTYSFIDPRIQYD